MPPDLPDSGRRPGPVEPRVLIGTDLVAVERVERLLEGQPGLAERVFTARELAYCTGRSSRAADHLAARFAAKEAVMKALGTGASAGVEWTDVEIVNRLDGRPVLKLHGRARQIADRKRVTQTEISLTHTAGLALAHTVLVCSAGLVGLRTTAGTPDPS
ncbi:holo-ACP synthase [Streptomyces sp. DG2A-72]|uniref:holo-ACP synthase n=1 Tax=Streptomyces sp. DG2A-72 TaxID=3051386 RepID=UPI00265C7419|nr:holo-ACP synthase [Streptomyces sp. DG2A-72]MDO0937270.1 holo-ACP synthase [Streptomyces sp. DG2A-72]